MTVNELLRHALASSYQVQVEDISPLVAKEQVDAAWGQFMPFLFTEYRYEDNFRRQNAIDWSRLGTLDPDAGSGDSDFRRSFYELNHRMGAGLGGKTPLGTEWELSYKVDRLINTVNQAGGAGGAIYSPEWESFAGITITQPILRDFGPKANLAEVRMAKIELGIAEFDREVALVNQSIEILNAIYDLVYAQENLRVKQEAVRVAGMLRDYNQRRRELGFLSPIDVTEAEVRISEAEEEAILARDFLRERKIRLLELMGQNVPSGAPLPDFSIIADLEPSAPVVDVDSLVSNALQTRPDYLLLKKELDREKVRLDYAQQQKLPELNLVFSYGYHGLAGEFDESWQEVTDGEEEAFSMGFTFTIPLDNRRLSSQYIAARHRRQQATLRLADLENRISLEVRNSVERLAALEQRLATARKTAQLADEALSIEQRRFETGQTDGLSVSQRQERSSDARSREVAAKVDFAKAIAELWATSGQLLPQYGISVERVVPVEENKRPFIRWHY